MCILVCILKYNMHSFLCIFWHFFLKIVSERFTWLVKYGQEELPKHKFPFSYRFQMLQVSWLTPATPTEIGFKQIWCQESLNQFERIFSILEGNVFPQKSNFWDELRPCATPRPRPMWQVGRLIIKCRWCTIGLQQILHGDTLEREDRKLHEIQNNSNKAPSRISYWEHLTSLLGQLHWFPLVFYAKCKLLVFAYILLYSSGPLYLKEQLPPYIVT